MRLLAADDDGFAIDVAPCLASPTATAFVALIDDEPVGWVHGHELVHPDGERTMLPHALS